MSETTLGWKYLERRPGSSYQQLAIKGKRIWAWTLYCQFVDAKEPRTPQQLAEDWAIPVDAVHEAILYCRTNPLDFAADQARDEALAEAIGMNDPAVKRSGRPRPLSTEDRAKLGL